MRNGQLQSLLFQHVLDKSRLRRQQTDHCLVATERCRAKAVFAVSRAFTLIEVIVALSLSLILISAVYSALTIHWRYEEAGRARIDQSQLSLALFRLVTEDIGSVVYSPPRTDSGDQNDSESFGASSGVSSATPASNTNATSGTSAAGSTVTPTTSESSSSSSVVASSDLGIVGTAELLQLDISHADQSEELVPGKAGVSGTNATRSEVGGQRRVVWGMVTPSRALAASSGEAEPSKQSLTVRPALARQMSDRLIEVVNGPGAEATNLPAALNETSIIAQEVVSLRFRYYDGYAWVEQWDSTEKGRLPRAVEMTLGFIQDSYKRPGSLNLPGSETILLQKHVVLVPVSVPVSGEEL